MYYRIIDFVNADYEVVLWTRTYNIQKITPCGVWIYDQYYSKRRFILNTSRKRYALPTIEEAKESYRQRKLKQISILDSQLNNARACLDALYANEINKPFNFV